jgi:hypothetical protein
VLFTSRSCTAGCAPKVAPLADVADGCDAIPSCVAGRLTLMFDEGALVTLAPVNVMVKVPAAVAVIERPLNVATPEPSVVALPPARAPPAPFSPAVISTPGIPFVDASWSFTAAENVAPLSALAGGWTVIASAVAAPGVSAIVFEKMSLKPVAEKSSV